MDRKKKLIIIIVAAVVIIGLGSFGAIEFTSKASFCSSCHEMDVAFAGWEGGVHQDMHCYNCHTDPGILNTVKVKANGLKEVYIHLTQDVNMDEVQAEVPSSRCINCHDLTDKEKYAERVVNFHDMHQKNGFECLTCHTPVGHTNNTFDGFKNDTCKTCHAVPAKKPAADKQKTTDSKETDSKETDSKVTDSKTTDSKTTDSKTTDSKTTDSKTTDSKTSTGATAKITLNLGHDLGAMYANSCATCHAGGAMLSKKPAHVIDGSTGSCTTCHTLKPKA